MAKNRAERMEKAKNIHYLNLQCLQVNGRTSVWVRICFFNIEGFLHRIPHSSHT